MSDQATPDGKGDCYIIAGTVAAALAQHPAEFRDVTIVHGIPVGRGGDVLGERFGHCWIEATINDDERVVVDVSNGAPLRFIIRDSYYELGQIDESENVAYTLNEWEAECFRTGNFGPWTDAHLYEVL